MNARLVILPGGLHAIFIRSPLPATRVYEKTVTGSGGKQTVSISSRRAGERSEREGRSPGEEGVLRGAVTSIWEDLSPPPGRKARAEH